MLNLRILSSGDVSACPCADYDGSPGLHLGNVNEKTLSEMYNSDRMAELLAASKPDDLPEICRECTFHTPMTDITTPFLRRRFESTVRFINKAGGVDDSDRPKSY